MTSEDIEKIRKMQEDHKLWAFQNFGPDMKSNLIDPVIGVIEEVGEFAHAFLKKKQKIRGTAAEHDANMKDALCDIGIFLMHFSSKCSIQYADVLLRAENHYESDAGMEVDIVRLTCAVKHLQVACLMASEEIVYPDVIRDQIVTFMRQVYGISNIIGFKLTDGILETWDKIVSKRNWKANQQLGTTE